MSQSPDGQKPTGLPQFPFGAVYFRKSNPPAEDWARDHRTAAADGLNTFRHWFLWGAIEVSPGVYDWSDYDRHLDLAAEHGIKTIIAEMVNVAPEWAYRRYAHARFETRDGRRVDSVMHGSCVVGGAPGLCLDNQDYRQAAEQFLRTLAERYRDHPGLGGYDIWNEINYPADVCYCPATVAEFRDWLAVRYGDLRALGEAWHRYSFETWEDVMPPRTLGPYPDVLDWLRFRIENAEEQLAWRARLFRELDPMHPVTAHGVAGSLVAMASNTRDDWRAATHVDSYGLTWVACRKGDEPWKLWHAVDLTRAAARGKPFWHAEAQGGPLWLQPQVVGRPREDGRIPTPDDLRLWHMTSFAGGALGLLYPRWRPLLDGPLFGAFGPYAMDGTRTERSETSSRLARWANAPEQAWLWEMRPVRGDVGIVVLPETQLFAYALLGDSSAYAQALEGVYRGFFDNNIQADWVRISDIDAYDVLYLPVPIVVSQASVDRLRQWVAAGGVLIAEGCPGYFDEAGRVETVQPGAGLGTLFGVRESRVEFAPDLVADLEIRFGEHGVPGGLFLQGYDVAGGTAVAWHDDGQAAIVDCAHGNGRVRLVGTMPGFGYAANPVAAARVWFAEALRFAGRAQHVSTGRSAVTARLHEGPAGLCLWVINPERRPVFADLAFGEKWGPFGGGEVLWGGLPQEGVQVRGRRVALTVDARDAVVVRLS